MTKSTKNKADETIKNGLETLYHSNGEKESEGKYKDNKKEGKWTFWNQDGRQIAQGSFKGGQKSGKWKEGNHQSTYTGNYKGDKKEGKWTEIWLGNKQEKYYSAGEITREIYYYDEKQKRDDKDYIKQHVTWWHRNGQKQKEGGIKDKVPHGEWSHWYENSQLESKGSYKNGTETGRWTYWYDDGQKHSEGHYKDRRRDGQWTYWYENGQKSAKGSFKTNQNHCGMIHGEGTKKDGRPNMTVWVGEKEEQKDGRWTYWHANGLKAAEGIYGDNNTLDSWGNLQKDISGEWPYGDEVSVTIPINRVFGNQKNGNWVYWHPNGIKARIEKWAYIHQGEKNSFHNSRNVVITQKVGWVSSWHPNGQLALKGFYTEDGYEVGDWKRWFVDGRIKSICNYFEPAGKDTTNPLENVYSVQLCDENNRKLEVFFGDKGIREGTWTISSLNGEILHELKYPDRLLKSEKEDEVSEEKSKDFDYYWYKPAYRFKKNTIEESISNHFKDDVNYHYVEYDSSMSIFDFRDDEKRKNEMYHSSGGSSSWLDGQALTDDEKLLGESFWRDIL